MKNTNAQQAGAREADTAEARFQCVVTPPDRKGRRLAEEAPGASEVTVTSDLGATCSIAFATERRLPIP